MKKGILTKSIIISAIVLPFLFGIISIGQKETASNELNGSITFIEADENVANNDEKSAVEQEEVSLIGVDISGAVHNPGFYILPDGSRVIDAIELAGGLTEDCDIDFLNRAELLSDEMKIYIPSIKDTQDLSLQIGVNKSFDASGEGGKLININTAGSAELQEIPGVGPVTADKIIEYRSSHGKFTSIDDLVNISGIGTKTLEKMKGYITIK